MSYFRNIFTLILALFGIFGGIFPAHAGEAAYPSITGPCNLEFPKDHGPHPDYHTEWWYYTGNVQSKDGERFGFQLTFFRSRLDPPGEEKREAKEEGGSLKGSAWRTEQIYLAHAALSDIGSKRFYHHEAMARGAAGLAGADQEGSRTKVFVKNWSLRIDPTEHVLRAKTEDFDLAFTLTPQKQPVLHGRSGYSLKGSTPERASCYYSFTRLEARGTIKIKGREIPVSGLSWMDHELSSAPLESDIVGWDWFSLQLSDKTELMIYLLRKKDGTYSPASSGTFVDASGKAIHLAADALSVEALDYWKSPHSGARYPSRWRIRVRLEDLDLAVSPNLSDQELQTKESTGVTYWEGSVWASGKSGGHPVEGEGYVELTGYAASLGGAL